MVFQQDWILQCRRYLFNFQTNHLRNQEGWTKAHCDQFLKWSRGKFTWQTLNFCGLSWIISSNHLPPLFDSIVLTGQPAQNYKLHDPFTFHVSVVWGHLSYLVLLPLIFTYFPFYHFYLFLLVLPCPSPTYFYLFSFLLFLLIFTCFTLPSSHSQVMSGHFSTQTDGVGHPSIAGERPIHLDNVSLFGHDEYWGWHCSFFVLRFEHHVDPCLVMSNIIMYCFPSCAPWPHTSPLLLVG